MYKLPNPDSGTTATPLTSNLDDKGKGTRVYILVDVYPISYNVKIKL